MPTFGPYTTVQRLHVTSVGAVYSARGPGLKEGELRAVRHLEPPVGVWDEDQIRLETEAFLGRAQAQQKMAAASPRFAPIYEFGLVDADDPGRGAYYVTDLYPRTAQRLIEGKVKLAPEDLRTLLLAVAKALLDVNRGSDGGLNRPHGNLRASNVLLSAAEIGKARIQLGDPVADALVDTKAGAEPDVMGLGKLLYELVLQRPYTGGTAPPGKEWSDLGKAVGEQYRELCNLLLNPTAPHPIRNLNTALAQLEAIKPPKRGKMMPLLAAAAGLVLVVGVVAYLMFGRGAPLAKEVWTREEWREVCTDYKSWFKNLQDQRDDPSLKDLKNAAGAANAVWPASLRARWFPTEAGAKIKLINPVLYAKEYDNKGYNIEDLMDEPLSFVQGSAGTRAGEPADLKALRDLKKFLTMAADSPEQWQVLRELQERGRAFNARGWTKVGAELLACGNGVKPEAKAEGDKGSYKFTAFDVVARMTKAMATATAAERVEKQYRQLVQAEGAAPAGGEAKSEILRRTGNALLEKFPQLVNAEAAQAEDLEGLKQKLEALDKLADALVAATKEGTIYWKDLAKDAAAPQGTEVTRAEFERLRTEFIPKYRELKPNPITAVDWNLALTDVKGRIEQLKTNDQNCPNLPAHNAAWQRVKDAVAAFPTPIFKNETELKRQTALAKATLEELGRAVDKDLVKPEDWLAGMAAWTFEDPAAKWDDPSATLKAAWRARHDALLGVVKKEPRKLEVGDYRNTQAKKFEQLRDAFRAIGKSLATDLPGFPQNERWEKDLYDGQVIRQRETVIAGLLGKLSFSQDVPNMSDPAFAAAWKKAREGYDQRGVDLGKLVGDLLALRGRLDGFYLRAREPADKDVPWVAAYGELQGRDLWKDAGVVTAIAPIKSRLDAAEALEGTKDIGTLLGTGGKELALIAWRRLGQLDWTDSRPTLAEVLALRDRVKQALAGGADAVWIRRLLDEVENTDRPEYWKKHLGALKDDATNPDQAAENKKKFAAALQVEADFGIKDPNDDRVIAYDQQLHRLWTLERTEKDEKLKTEIKDFLAFAESKDNAVSRNAAVKKSLGEFRKLIEDSEKGGGGGGDAAKMGPELAELQANNAPTFKRVGTAAPDTPVVYEWASPKGTIRLEFVPLKMKVRKDGADVDRTVYLATTTVSLGVFADVLEAAGKLDEMGQLIAFPEAMADVWAKWGPRVWKKGRSSLVPNKEWLWRDPQMTGGGAEGEKLPLTAPTLKVEPPGRDMPMQHLSPAAALYFSRLLGCRLLTSGEWRAAYEKFEKTGAVDAWNLRDQAWAAQLEFVKANAGKIDWPDAGIFVPAGLNVKREDAAEAWTRAGLRKVASASAPARVGPGEGLYADGVLFFRAARKDQPGVVQDLVGNVAEYVFDSLSQTEPPKTGGGPVKVALTPKEAEDALKKEKEQVGVIGGSALSPPDLAFDQMYPVDVLKLLDVKGGFSDVGLRLAFTAPTETLADGLARIRGTLPYLPGPLAQKP